MRCMSSRMHGGRLRVFRPAILLLLVAGGVCAIATVRAQQVNPSYFADLRWRSIGPPRSGYV